MQEKSKIVTKIEELCQEIINDERFCEIQKSILNFNENADKYPEYFDFLDYQGELEEKKHSGEAISQEEAQKYQQMLETAFEIPDVVKFVRCQDQLDQLSDLVGQYIDFTLDHGRVPSSEELEEDNCQDGSCGCGC